MNFFLLNTRATRTAISSALLLLAASLPAQAQPFLVCDPPMVGDPPVVDEQVVRYEITGVGSEVIVADPDPSGLHGIKHDLMGLPVGDYTVTLRACNMWECSDPSVPLSFPRPSKPASPGGADITFSSGGGKNE